MIKFSDSVYSAPVDSAPAISAPDFDILSEPGYRQVFPPQTTDHWEEPVSDRRTGISPPDRISPDSPYRAVSRQPSVY